MVTPVLQTGKPRHSEVKHLVELWARSKRQAALKHTTAWEGLCEALERTAERVGGCERHQPPSPSLGSERKRPLSGPRAA